MCHIFKFLVIYQPKSYWSVKSTFLFFNKLLGKEDLIICLKIFFLSKILILYFIGKEHTYSTNLLSKKGNLDSEN